MGSRAGADKSVRELLRNAVQYLPFNLIWPNYGVDVEDEQRWHRALRDYLIAPQLQSVRFDQGSTSVEALRRRVT